MGGAYADEPQTLVDETPFSPAAISRASENAGDARSAPRYREMLDLFYQEAMTFLERLQMMMPPFLWIMG